MTVNGKLDMTGTISETDINARIPKPLEGRVPLKMPTMFAKGESDMTKYNQV